MASAAVLLSSGCGGADAPAARGSADLRRASFQSFAARERVVRCVGADDDAAGVELRRFETLKDFARRRGPEASQRLWRGENDWNAASPRGAAEPCGNEPAVLADFRVRLDALANAIMDHEE